MIPMENNDAVIKVNWGNETIKMIINWINVLERNKNDELEWVLIEEWTLMLAVN